MLFVSLLDDLPAGASASEVTLLLLISRITSAGNIVVGTPVARTHQGGSLSPRYEGERESRWDE